MKSNLISLSDRFALWIGFYDNNKENYLQTVKYYLKLSDKTLSKDYVKRLWNGLSTKAVSQVVVHLIC